MSADASSRYPADRVAALTHEARLPASARKIRPPFVLDPSMCFYSPQENVEALAHPRVAAWLEFVAREWAPTPVRGSVDRLALLLPCTKYKPYPTSREHRAVNAALLAAGWEPTGGEVPAELEAVLDPGEDPRVLDVTPLVRDGVVLDRFVVSEPLGLVPYEHTYYWRGEPSPATAYDDSGLFEARGTSVSPYRDDCTAVPLSGGRWRWGPGERDAFVTMHALMVDVITMALARLATHYAATVAWVSPGLTHVSFLADASRRAANGIPASRQGLHARRPLTGVLDALPDVLDLLPNRRQLDAATAALAERLAAEGRPADPAAVRVGRSPAATATTPRWACPRPWRTWCAGSTTARTGCPRWSGDGRDRQAAATAVSAAATGTVQEVRAIADGAPLGSVRHVAPDDVPALVAAARAALPGWRGAAPHARAALLKAAADELRARSAELAVLHARESGQGAHAGARRAARRRRPARRQRRAGPHLDRDGRPDRRRARRRARPDDRRADPARGGRGRRALQLPRRAHRGEGRRGAGRPATSCWSSRRRRTR